MSAIPVGWKGTPRDSGAGLEIIFDNCYPSYQISAAFFNCCYRTVGRLLAGGSMREGSARS
jgi:hypothetical protein